MPEQAKDRLLSNAGGLLMAAGFIAALTGGLYGLSTTKPGLVVLSVLLLIGYGVVGYLLMNRGGRDFHVVFPATAVLVVLTLFLFRSDVGTFLDDDGGWLLYPTLTLLLAFAGGALLTHAVEQATARVAWPGKQPGALNAMLHVSAYAPVWNAFLLLDLLGQPSTLQRVVVVGGSVLVAVACVLGGYASTRRSHPAVTLGGAAVGFLGAVFYLFEFMMYPWSRTGLAWFGQFNALLGLILTGLPIAIAAVAWIQLASGDAPEAEAGTGPAP